MRYVIMSDYHGADLEAMEVPEFLEEMRADAIISMGDFDQTRTIRQFLELRDRYPVIEVPGNHDYAILLGQTIFSGTMLAQGKTAEQLCEELHADNVALAYIRHLVDFQSPGRVGNSIRLFLDETRLGKRYPAVVVHGALAGNMDSFRSCPDSMRDVWARLESKGDRMDNFRAMAEAGANIMIRGHDHDPTLVTLGEDSLQTDSGRSGAAHWLCEGLKYVINPGALYSGWLAMLDTSPETDGHPVHDGALMLTYFGL